MDDHATAGMTAEPDKPADEPCCTAVSHGLAQRTVEDDVRALAAMGNETRYETLRLLAATDGDVCACDLAPELDVDQSTTSRALKTLYEAGLVDRRKDGRWRYYATTPRAETLLSAIDSIREKPTREGSGR